MMERLEAAQSRLKEAGAERATIGADARAVTARRDLALAELAELAGKASDRRAERRGARSRLTCSTCTTGCALSTAASARRRCGAASARAATCR